MPWKAVVNTLGNVKNKCPQPELSLEPPTASLKKPQGCVPGCRQQHEIFSWRYPSAIIGLPYQIYFLRPKRNLNNPIDKSKKRKKKNVESYLVQRHPCWMFHFEQEKANSNFRHSVEKTDAGQRKLLPPHGWRTTCNPWTGGSFLIYFCCLRRQAGRESERMHTEPSPNAHYYCVLGVDNYMFQDLQSYRFGSRKEKEKLKHYTLN